MSSSVESLRDAMGRPLRGLSAELAPGVSARIALPTLIGRLAIAPHPKPGAGFAAADPSFPPSQEARP
jgi:hypothetical protein